LYIRLQEVSHMVFVANVVPKIIIAMVVYYSPPIYWRAHQSKVMNELLGKRIKVNNVPGWLTNTLVPPVTNFNPPFESTIVGIFSKSTMGDHKGRVIIPAADAKATSVYPGWKAGDSKLYIIETIPEFNWDTMVVYLNSDNYELI